MLQCQLPLGLPSDLSLLLSQLTKTVPDLYGLTIDLTVFQVNFWQPLDVLMLCLRRRSPQR